MSTIEAGDVVERLEYADPPGMERRAFLRRSALAGAGAAALSSMLAACGANGGDSDGGQGAGNFPKTRKFRFVAKVGEMLDAFNTALTSKADGIAIPLVDPKAFNSPVEKALGQGIPVMAYNADVPPPKNKRLCYIGQDLFESGVQMGNRIVSLVPSGDVALFIATPGALNIQPRIDGAISAIKKSGKPINYKSIATGAEVNEELSRVDAYYIGHKGVKGMFAVDAGTTQSLGQVMKKYKLAGKIKAGGFDTLPKTLEALQAGDLDFSIDQQAYLQGFLPVLQLYIYKLSGSLTGIAEVNTGLKFVTKDSADLYVSNPSRFEGSTKKQKVINA